MASRLAHQNHDGLRRFRGASRWSLTLETTITCSQVASMQPATRGGMVAGAKMPQKIGYARWAKERCELHVIITVITGNSRLTVWQVCFAEIAVI